MKIATLLLSFCWWLGAKAQTTEAPNLFIITIDGLRWQEVFAGADSALLHDGRFTHDTSLAKALFWAATPQERRAQLLPFCWNVIAKQGLLLGNRAFGNEVNVSNLYKISYAGYNELLTGTTDLRLFSNAKKYNTHRNVLEKLNAMPDYRGRIAAFSSWEVFPYILNQPHNGLPVNSGYDTATTAGETMAQAVQRQGVSLKGATRYDLLTFVTAMDYIRQQRPKVVLLGFGEADEFAHHGRYDAYLQSAQQFDRLLQELWYWVQTTPGYANNTSFVITTDHGRGKKGSIGWQGHGALIRGSGEVWRAVIGPAFEARGEVRQAGRLYQKHLPQLVEALLAKPNFGRSNSPSLASAR